MKAIKKYLCCFILIIFFFSLTMPSLFASSISENGLSIEMKTNQTNYNSDESIQADLRIKNENEYPITIIEAKNIIPEGFKLDSNSKELLENKELNVGEIIHLQTTFEKIEDISSSLIVKTGDNNHLLMPLLVLGMGVSLLIFIKFKNTRKLLIVLLVSSCITSFFDYGVFANDTIKELEVNEKITYAGKDITLHSVVTYTDNNSGNNPKDPIVYQDGIEETELEYELNEKNKEIFIQNSHAIAKWKEQEIHVLKNKNNPKYDIAIRIERIEYLENGTAHIYYSNPNITEVVKSIDYAGSEMKNGTINPAEYVTFNKYEEQQNRVMKESQIATLSLLDTDVRGHGSFNFNEKLEYKYNHDGIYFEGVLSLEKINYDFEMECGLTGIHVSKMYTTLDSNISLNMKAKSDFGGKHKFEVAHFESCIGYGFFAEGVIYAYISASGEITFDYEIDVSCGFDYSNNKFEGIWDIDGKLNEAKASVDLKVGMTAVPQITFLKMGLIGGEFDYGRNYELDFEIIASGSLEYCLDAGYYNYANVSAVILPGSWDKKFTANLMDKDNSHIKETSHYEELGIVSECTRKYGALEGIVLKHDGNENLPLLLATVTLEKDGEVKYETKTGAKGIFSFAKEIEKGTYDIFVRSNQYETYKGTVKIVGNSNNKIEKPIVLEPYAKSVVVRGKVYNDTSKEPIYGATVSVKGYEDRVTTTDVEGKYSLELPLGEQTVDVSAPSYGSKSYSGTFTKDTRELNFGLIRKYSYEVLEIRAGESYQFDFTTGKKIFVRSDGVAEYSSYLAGDKTYHRRAKDIEFYRGSNPGEHWEIKVYSGSLTVFASEGDFFTAAPDSDLSNYCAYASMQGVDPFITHKLSAGNAIVLDNQEDLPKSTSYVFNFIGEGEVTGTEEVTDYYYATHFGWKPSISIYDITSNKYWRPLQNLVKVKVTITSGNATIYYYRLDPFTVTLLQ